MKHALRHFPEGYSLDAARPAVRRGRWRRAAAFLAALASLAARPAGAGVEGGQALDPLEGRTSQPGIVALRFSPDGRWLAAAAYESGAGGPVLLWRTADWRLQWRRFELSGAMCLAFWPNSGRLAYGARHGRLKTFDVQTGEQTGDAFAHAGPVHDVAIAPDGSWLVSCGGDGKISWWRGGDLGRLRSWRQQGKPPRVVAVSPDGRRLLWGGMDGAVRLADSQAEKTPDIVDRGPTAVRDAAFSRDGRLLWTLWDHGLLVVRQTNDFRVRLRMADAGAAALSGDGRRLVVGGRSGGVRRYDVELRPPSEPERRRIASWIQRLDSDAYREREAAARAVVHIGLLAEPLLREAAAGGSAEVRLRARQLLDRVLAPPAAARRTDQPGPITAISISPDGQLAACGSAGGEICVRRLATLETIATLRDRRSPAP